MSPRIEHAVSRLNLALTMEQFDEQRHLKEREHQYCNMNLISHGIYVIRETEEGWWRESIDFKDDVKKQIEKLIDDPTVACAWVNQARFNEPGGWHDPS